MSLLDGDLLRAKVFTRRVRGDAPAEVAAYLGRVALVTDVLDVGTGPVPELPADFVPDAIRSQAFTTIWFGYDRTEVRFFLTRLAVELEQELKLRENQPLSES